MLAAFSRVHISNSALLSSGLQVFLLAQVFLQYVLLWGFVADDALIAARYGTNLARGNGLVFNVGEQILAATSPLHVLLGSLLAFVFGDSLRPYIILMAISVPLVLIATSRAIGEDPRERLVFLSLTLASPFVILWTIGGLETPLLLIVVTVMGVIAVSARVNQSDAPLKRLSLLIYPLGALAFLIRHDAVLFAAPLVLAELWRNRRNVAHWLAFVGSGLVAASWLAFAWFYYGDILPTSYYIKAPGLSGYALLKGIAYIASGAALSLAWVRLVGRLGALAETSKSVLQEIRMAPAVFVGLGAVLLYGAYAGAVHMMFSYRFFVPYLPVAIIVLLRAVCRAGLHSAAPARTMTILAGQFLITLWIAFVTVNPTIFWFAPIAQLTNLRYEYATASARSYSDTVAFAANGAAAAAHWNRQPESTRRQPRLYSFAGGGMMPYFIPDAIVIERLFSYRHQCRQSGNWSYLTEENPLMRSADYIHVLSPHYGTLERQLGSLRDNFILVSREATSWDGREGFYDVYFNPEPSPYPLPARIDGPCQLDYP